jgi:ribosomal protein L27
MAKRIGPKVAEGMHFESGAVIFRNQATVWYS